MKQKQDSSTVDIEDIFEWADGSWCYRYEYGEYSKNMSDDFKVLFFDSPSWIKKVETESGA